MFKFKNSYKLFLIFVSMLCFIVNSQSVIFALKEALVLICSTVIPSLFPFMVLSSLFVGNIGENSLGILSKVFQRLFGISSYGCSAFICGMLCGYPVGAKSVASLYKENKISLSESESLVAYSNNSGPLFVIGAVGIGMFSSFKIGIALYLIHILSAVLSAILLKPYTYSKVCKTSKTASSKDITLCICESTASVLNVCGFILFFAAVNAVILPVLNKLPVYLKLISSSALEITNAANMISLSPIPKDIKISLCALALGWSGMSVHMQVKSIVAPLGISMKKYYIVRLFISIISSVFALVSTAFADDIAIFALENVFLTFFIFASIITAIYIYSLRYKKI